MTTFIFFGDPGHGWLQVTPAQVAEAGLNRRDFSNYSYVDRRGEFFYLEEDCDAPKFLDAWTARHGKPGLREVYLPSDDTQPMIRRMARL